MFDDIAELPGARDTTNLLANSQIVVYPISLRGLETDPTYSPLSRAPVASSSGFFERAAFSGAMEDLAWQTGGEAFLGTNDFAGALRRGMSDGASYYTLAYRPGNQQWDGHFRKIRVQLVKSGYDLAYRRGYFGSSGISQGGRAQELAMAMQPEMPVSTMLALKSKIELPDAQHSSVRVDCTVNAGSVELLSGADGHRRGLLLVSLVAQNEHGGTITLPPQNSGVLRLDFSPSEYDQIMKSGIGFREQIMLKSGSYRLRIGVSDMNNHRVGTLDMPVQIAARGQP